MPTSLFTPGFDHNIFGGLEFQWEFWWDKRFIFHYCRLPSNNKLPGFGSLEGEGTYLFNVHEKLPDLPEFFADVLLRGVVCGRGPPCHIDDVTRVVNTGGGQTAQGPLELGC